MPSSSYYAWISAGKPVDPCTPVREYVERLKATFPQDAIWFSWYANAAHYEATPPQDHTPFSATGWPLPSPHWVVFATDVMHHPTKGVDCNVLFPYWLSEAKAGRTPWVKYIIWQAKLYDVRRNWAPVANSGHYDHVHLSMRTDHQFTHLGAWSVVPNAQGGSTMAQCLVTQPVSMGGDGTLWLADGMWRRRVKQADLVAIRQVHSSTNPPLFEPLLNAGNVFETSNLAAWGEPTPTNTPGGNGVSEARVKELIGQSAITPPPEV